MMVSKTGDLCPRPPSGSLTSSANYSVSVGRGTSSRSRVKFTIFAHKGKGATSSMLKDCCRSLPRSRQQSRIWCREAIDGRGGVAVWWVSCCTGSSRRSDLFLVASVPWSQLAQVRPRPSVAAAAHGEGGR